MLGQNLQKKAAVKAGFLELSSLVATTYSRAKALPSALMYFTSEFEMGSGGTTSV